ncbi:H(+)-transporting V1 sector ATPase subunit G [Orbilia oligospora]|uniref:V-type proton ATPase subunit G n=1 Tax=Orbilia oligospora TaxID=2813651 RepID=A0A7C8RBN1_ORBOL|nr:H(+)-transporting V1 sector ATPase subunit G [Orbilia oligospora]
MTTRGSSTWGSSNRTQTYQTSIIHSFPFPPTPKDPETAGRLPHYPRTSTFFVSKYGIQTLLNAEQEAQKIVQKARAYRVQRVKDARAEAQKEIEEYRQKKEEEFQKFEAEHTGINAQAEKDAEKEIEGKLKEIEEAGKKSRAQVIEDLIKAVTTVEPKPHINSKHK